MMLSSLTVKNIALIEEARLEFSGGLNVLSGETGAGKSVLLSALDFVLGAKAEKGMIRSGETECSVRAEFRVDGELDEVLDELDLEGGELLVISRRFSSDGKGSIKINGASVTGAMLKSVTGRLVDVHGQSDHFYLLKEGNQLKLVDGVAGRALVAQKEALRPLLKRRRELIEDRKRLGGDEGERQRRLDILRYQIEEIERANVTAEEENELNTRREKILNAEKILTALQTAVGALNGEGGGTDALHTAARALSSLHKFGEGYSALFDRLQALSEELNDVTACLEEEAAAFDFDDEEAERVENRIAEIKSLKKKYGGSIEATEAFYEEAKKEFALLSDCDERLEKGKAELLALNGKIFEHCKKMTEIRRTAAEGFALRVSEELKSLNIAAAQFTVEFAPYTQEDVSSAGEDGLDRVKFLFSANAGEPLKELAKIASGGETSRFMLAVKAQLNALGGIGTYVFDEIDAGISGRTARVVAEKFARIAKNTQIIAVSHLAQIASFADRQFLIEKSEEGGKTKTRIFALDSKGRQKEIARLVGGETGEIALKQADELLRQAENYKNSLA